MDNTDIIALTFLVLGGGFVFSLLKGIMSLLGENIDEKTKLGPLLLKTFRVALICVTLLIIFILLVLPNLK